jgi:signal transduction histidine kinase
MYEIGQQTDVITKIKTGHDEDKAELEKAKAAKTQLETRYSAVSAQNEANEKYVKDRRTEVNNLLQMENMTLEQKVEERTRELQENIRELEAFTYTMAHDLRAPLRALHGYSDILREELEGVLSASDKDYLNRIGEAARRMDRLVLDLLDFAHLIHYPVQNQEIDAEGLLRTVESALEKELKPGTADVRLEGSIPRVRGEVGLVTEVLRQLLFNALRAKEEGMDRRIRVRVHAERRDEWVRISVEDNGPEIPVQHHPRVFEPGERWRPGDATGMGLAIVRKAVERMDGHVGVEPAPEGGSRFWFELRAA